MVKSIQTVMSVSYHVDVTGEKADNTIWNNGSHLNQKVSIIPNDGYRKKRKTHMQPSFTGRWALFYKNKERK